MANSGPIQPQRFDATQLQRVRVRPDAPSEYVDWIQVAINEPSCIAAFQEFRKEEPLNYWVMWYDEIHFGLSGSATLVYRMPPLYEEEFRLEVKAGDLYLLPIGVDTSWEVTSDEPYRSLFVCMPRPKWLEL